MESLLEKAMIAVREKVFTHLQQRTKRVSNAIL